MHHLLECFSRTWGGVSNIIIPCTTEEEIAEPFWRILTLFDPDYFCWYQPTYRAWQLTDPAGFEEWARKEVEKAIGDSGKSAEEVRASFLSPEQLKKPLPSKHPTKNSRRVLETMAPYHSRDRAFSRAFRADDTPPVGFPDVTTLQPSSEGTVLLFHEAFDDPLLNLLLIGRAGALAPSHWERLQADHVPVERVRLRDSDVEAALAFAWLGDSSALRDCLTRDGYIAAVPNASFEAMTPFGRTLVGLTRIQPGLDESWDRRPFALIIGDTADDFSLALALDRLLAGAAWVPSCLRLGNSDRTFAAGQALRSVLSEAMWNLGGERPILITSISARAEEQSEFEMLLRSLLPQVRGLPTPHLEVCDPLRIPLPLRTPQVVDERAWDIGDYEPFVGADQQTRLNTPLPTRVQAKGIHDLQWQVDVRIQDYCPPARACLNARFAVGLGAWSGGIRSGRNALTYASHGGMILSGLPLDKNVQRPQLHLPDVLEIFHALLERAGLRAEPSIAGRHASEVLRLWGGLARLAEALRDGPELRILMSFLSREKSDVEPGVFLNDMRRRFLSFAELTKVAEVDKKKVRDLVDEYVTRGILRRGYLFQCQYCRLGGWYPLEDVGQSFRCWRCRKDSMIAKPSWKSFDEPPWHYDLMEVVYQAVHRNARSPILALAELGKGSLPFAHVTEMDVYDVENSARVAEVDVYDVENSARVAEVDVWAIADGKIIVGEAKTVDRLGKSVKEENRVISGILRVAEGITADEAVFATTETWRETTRQRVEEVFARSRVRPRILQRLGQ